MGWSKVSHLTKCWSNLGRPTFDQLVQLENAWLTCILVTHCECWMVCKTMIFWGKGHHFRKWWPKGTVSAPPFLSGWQTLTLKLKSGVNLTLDLSFYQSDLDNVLKNATSPCDSDSTFLTGSPREGQGAIITRGNFTWGNIFFNRQSSKNILQLS